MAAGNDSLLSGLRVLVLGCHCWLQATDVVWVVLFVSRFALSVFLVQAGRGLLWNWVVVCDIVGVAALWCCAASTELGYICS
jgi:hypothetical protein